MSTAAPVTVSQAIAIALEHHRAGRLAEAENIYRQVIAADPKNFDALHLLGVACLQAGRPNEAVRHISDAIALNGEHSHAYNNLGETYRALGDLEDARNAFEKAISLNPDSFQAHNNLGNVYQARERLEEAEACYRKAMALNPNYPEARVNLGNILQDRGEWDDAIEQYEIAIELRPEYGAALNNLGNTLRAQRKLEEALPYFQRAVAADPRHVQALVNLGHVLLALGSRNEAVRHFERALILDPENAEARWALTFSQLALVHAADESQGDFRQAFSTALHELDAWLDEARLEAGSEAVGTLQPFYLAYHEENNRLLLGQYGAMCVRVMRKWQAKRDLHARTRRTDSKRVRLAIVSAQIYDQSVWNAIIKGWCTTLDPSRVEISVFHLGFKQDQQTGIARSSSAHFEYGVRPLNRWAADLHAHRPDVIAYPEIGMDPMSLRLASLRLAPVQIAAWGHPETTGLPTIDCYISADAFEPADADDAYTERLIRLPTLGTHYSPLEVPAMELDHDRLGIDTAVPLYVCPGAPFKYLPQHDHVFVDIARKVGKCRFLFFEYTRKDLHLQLRERMQHVFDSANLPFSRFVTFLPWLRRDAFYALLRGAHVYLDTIGFSGFNTAIQAVECGLPVVTLRGRFMRGRFGSGILERIGLQELVAADAVEYVDIAARIALDPAYRTRVVHAIEDRRGALFDDVTPIRAFEEFLAQATAGTGATAQSA
jgi:predicted O-linked N-acetylglucosamine transferase (SPINDLY family)